MATNGIKIIKRLVVLLQKLIVQVHFLEPIYYDEYKDMKTTEIAAEVKKRIEATITQYTS